MKLNKNQLELINKQLIRLKGNNNNNNGNGFYKNKLGNIKLTKNQEEFEQLPFTDKNDLREAYPLGLQAVSDEDIIRIHSSSGTTGTPVIIPYTAQDIEDWVIMFERCYKMAGVTKKDVIHITPGYGLWTAGIGFQNGAERLGAMTIPMGPGNTDKQLKMMIDLKSSVICATSSYALLLAEEIAKRGINNQIHLKKGIIGSERWGKKMRQRIANELGVKLYDIYGLTEIYGPGIGISCEYECGMHLWDDYLYFEIIDPKTCEVLPDGEIGELVITTLKKEGAPLIRYRTHDLTCIIPGKCKCGSKYPKIGILVGRTDDMVKVKGVNIFPSQIDEVLAKIKGASSEYQFMIDHLNERDICTLFVEVKSNFNRYELEKETQQQFKSDIGIIVNIKPVNVGDLPRNEKKSTRIFDNRY